MRKVGRIKRLAEGGDSLTRRREAKLEESREWDGEEDYFREGDLNYGQRFRDTFT